MPRHRSDRERDRQGLRHRLAEFAVGYAERAGQLRQRARPGCNGLAGCRDKRPGSRYSRSNFAHTGLFGGNDSLGTEATMGTTYAAQVIDEQESKKRKSF